MKGVNSYKGIMLYGTYHLNKYILQVYGAVVAVLVWYLDLQLSVQSVPITTKVVSSNRTHGEVYSIQHHGIKFVGDFRQVGGFLRFS
jgi:hypothetical protein